MLPCIFGKKNIVVEMFASTITFCLTVTDFSHSSLCKRAFFTRGIWVAVSDERVTLLGCCNYHKPWEECLKCHMPGFHSRD